MNHPRDPDDRWKRVRALRRRYLAGTLGEILVPREPTLRRLLSHLLDGEPGGPPKDLP